MLCLCFIYVCVCVHETLYNANVRVTSVQWPEDWTHQTYSLSCTLSILPSFSSWFVFVQDIPPLNPNHHKYTNGVVFAVKGVLPPLCGLGVNLCCL